MSAGPPPSNYAPPIPHPRYALPAPSSRPTPCEGVWGLDGGGGGGGEGGGGWNQPRSPAGYNVGKLTATLHLISAPPLPRG